MTQLADGLEAVRAGFQRRPAAVLAAIGDEELRDPDVQSATPVSRTRRQRAIERRRL